MVNYYRQEQVLRLKKGELASFESVAGIQDGILYGCFLRLKDYGGPDYA